MLPRIDLKNHTWSPISSKNIFNYCSQVAAHTWFSWQIPFCTYNVPHPCAGFRNGSIPWKSVAKPRGSQKGWMWRRLALSGTPNFLSQFLSILDSLWYERDILYCYVASSSLWSKKYSNHPCSRHSCFSDLLCAIRIAGKLAGKVIQAWRQWRKKKCNTGGPEFTEKKKNFNDVISS